MALSGSVSTSKYDGRYLKLSWEAKQDIATNKSTITWVLSAAGGNSSYYYDGPITVKIAGDTVYEKEGRTKRYKGEIKSGTKTITHESDGTKSFSVSVKAAIYSYSVNCTGSKTFTLDTIPRAATISSADSFTDEGNPVLKYSNPLGSSVTTLQACIASQDGNTIYVPYRDISKTGTSYTFNLTDEERETLRQACVNSKTLPVKFYVKTIYSGTTYKNSLEKTLTITNANPSMTVLIYANDSATTTLMGADGMIKGISDIYYSITATAEKHATIKSYSVVNGSTTKTTASGVFTNATGDSFAMTITDSRGYSTTNTVKISNCVSYVNPTATLEYSNVGVDGTVDLHCSGSCYSGSFGSTANTIAIKYRYKEVGGEFGSYISAGTVSASNNSYNHTFEATGLDYHKTYVIEYMVEDKLATKTSNSITINFLPKFDWGENDFNFNIPVFSSAPIQIHSLCMGCSEDLSVTNSFKTINVGTRYGGTGDLLEAYDGGIRCKADGVVLAMGAVHVKGVTAGNTIQARIHVNGEETASTYTPTGTKTFATAPITPKIFHITEGSVIKLAVKNYDTSGGTVGAANSTILTVIYLGGTK